MCVVQTPEPALLTDPLIELKVSFLLYTTIATVCVSMQVEKDEVF